MKKNNPLFIVLFWILWGVGLHYVSEYIISRPISGILQFGIILVVLGFTALLIKKTHDYIINLLKN
jgi:hypothetical protein